MARGAYYQDGGTQRTLTSIAYQDGGTQRILTEGYYQDGGTLRQWWPPQLVVLSNRDIQATILVAGTATATFNLLSSGVASGSATPTGSGGGNYSPEWGVGETTSNYEARWTTVSGSLSSGTAGTWLNLGTNRTWTVSRAAIGVNICVGTVEIRETATGTVVATATITLYAERA